MESSVNYPEKEVNNDVINFTWSTNLAFLIITIGGKFRKNIFHCHKLFYFGKAAKKKITENMNITRAVNVFG